VVAALRGKGHKGGAITPGLVCFGVLRFVPVQVCRADQFFFAVFVPAGNKRSHM